VTEVKLHRRTTNEQLAWHEGYVFGLKMAVPEESLVVSEAELATALHRSGLTCDDIKPLAPAHYETDHTGDAAALFAALREAALVAAQEKGEAGS
jgi:hypothetical protein